MDEVQYICRVIITWCWSPVFWELCITNISWWIQICHLSVQVSITAMEESRVLIWHRDKLKLTMITDQFLQAVFDHILGRDVVKKLMQVIIFVSHFVVSSLGLNLFPPPFLAIHIGTVSHFLSLMILFRDIFTVQRLLLPASAYVRTGNCFIRSARLWSL